MTHYNSENPNINSRVIFRSKQPEYQQQVKMGCITPKKSSKNIDNESENALQCFQITTQNKNCSYKRLQIYSGNIKLQTIDQSSILIRRSKRYLQKQIISLE